MTETDFLYHLLPVIYRQRDLAAGMPLRALLAVMQEQYDLLEGDIAALYDNWFVETCEPWVLPYIAELVGSSRLTRSIRGGIDRRGFVANTLAYRRRKGAAATIERAVEDATGWPTRVVAFADLLASTATTRRPRPGAGGAIAIRDAWSLACLGGAFDDAARVPDVRVGGRYNRRRVGLFLWRLQSYPLRRVRARSLGEGRHTFHPLGWDMPLLNRRVGAAGVDRRGGIRDVPMALTRRMLAAERPGRGRVRPVADRFLNTRPAFAIYWSDATDPLPPEQIAIADLGTWRWPAGATSGARVAVDPGRGRLLARDNDATILTDHCYGFAGDIGGGPYARPAPLDDERSRWRARVRGDGDDLDGGAPLSAGSLPEWPPEGAGGVRAPTPDRGDDVHLFGSLGEALAAFAGQPRDGLIEIADSATYAPDHAADSWAADLRSRGSKRLTIRAASHQRPCLAGALDVTAASADAQLRLEGLLIGGAIRASGRLTLALRHCTVRAGASGGARLVVEKSIVGPLRLGADAEQLTIHDSIVDGGGGHAVAAPSLSGDHHDDLLHAGPPAVIARATVLGAVAVAQIEASNTIFAAAVRVAHDHLGSLRHCYVADGSRTPPRFACLAGPAVTTAVRDGIRPLFTSLRPGQAGYGQLAPDCPPAFMRAASDGTEIGAFHGLGEDWRAEDLDELLAEQLPFGLDPLTVWAT